MINSHAIQSQNSSKVTGDISKNTSEFASFTCKFTCNHLGLFARLITIFSLSSMVLLQHACVFLGGFLESRNYKIQVIAHVEGKSAVVLSGIMEASDSRFFIGQGFNYSFSSVYREASKTITQKPRNTSRVEESNSPRKALHD